MAKTNDVPPLVGGLCRTAPNVSVVLQEVGGLRIMGKWMARGETGGMQGDEWHTGRQMECGEMF